MTAYEDIFGVPADPEADRIQDAKHAVGETKQQQAITLQLQAAVNLRYAEAIERTWIESDGARGSLYMVEVHRNCAARKLLEADRLFPAYVIGD